MEAVKLKVKATAKYTEFYEDGNLILKVGTIFFEHMLKQLDKHDKYEKEFDLIKRSRKHEIS